MLEGAYNFEKRDLSQAQAAFDLASRALGSFVYIYSITGQAQS